MLEGGLKFTRKPPVGDQNDTDHQALHARASPHERGTIMFIRNPGARAALPI
jgi:hypothetical protein